MRSEMRGDGLYVFEESRDKRAKRVRITDRFETLARVSDPRTGGAYGLRVEFTDERGRAKRTVIPASAFYSNTREICATLSELGLYIDRSHQESLIDYLQHKMKRAPSADLATAPGWLTPSVYVLPDAVFGEQENGQAVYYGGDDRGHNYRSNGTLQEWQHKVAQPCEGNSRLILPVCMGFTGPLMSEAGEQSGGVHVHGLTTTGKTTTQVVGGSVCGGGDSRTGFVSSWRTTSNGLEPLLANHNDGTLFLDEIGQADARAISELIYTAANSTGKNRMTRSCARHQHCTGEL